MWKFAPFENFSLYSNLQTLLTSFWKSKTWCGGSTWVTDLGSLSSTALHDLLVQIPPSLGHHHDSQLLLLPLFHCCFLFFILFLVETASSHDCADRDLRCTWLEDSKTNETPVTNKKRSWPLHTANLFLFAWGEVTSSSTSSCSSAARKSTQTTNPPSNTWQSSQCMQKQRKYVPSLHCPIAQQLQAKNMTQTDFTTNVKATTDITWYQHTQHRTHKKSTSWCSNQDSEREGERKRDRRQILFLGSGLSRSLHTQASLIPS